MKMDQPRPKRRKVCSLNLRSSVPPKDLSMSKVKSEVESAILTLKTDDSLQEEHSFSDKNIEHFDYVKFRDENLEANKLFLESIGVDKAKSMLLSTRIKPERKSSKVFKFKKTTGNSTPQRQSMRLRKISASEVPLLPSVDTNLPEIREERIPPGPINMSECTVGGEYKEILNSSLLKNKKTFSNNILLNKLESINTNEDRVEKIVQGRIMSLTWHPSMVVAIAGDKYGHVGLWNVTNKTVSAFKPHSKPVSNVCVSETNQSKLYSSSYDGTIRCGDFTNEVFDELFSIPDDENDLLYNFAFIDDGFNSILVSHYSGRVSLVDARTASTSFEAQYIMSPKPIRCISSKPSDRNYFITSGLDTKINLWDLRKLNKTSPKPIHFVNAHTKAISSSYFSPLTGNKIVSSGADDYINLFNVNNNKIELYKSILHNNHTGRWLTNFRPIWHPRLEDYFVVGSMEFPRRIEIFHSDGNIVLAKRDENYLQSICSLNAFHPQHPCALVGANSSGKLYVFM